MVGADWLGGDTYQNKQIVTRRRARFIGGLDVRL